MIDFNHPPYTGKEFEYMKKAVDNHKICGDGEFTKKCEQFMCDRFGYAASYLATSGTDALELAALLCDIKPGDEVILPSYTFCSTADAFVLRGAKLVFVDIRPDTMNIDETKIEDAITDKTKVIAVVHYAGVACEMDTIMDIARRHHLIVVEDAAQAFGSTYKGRYLGGIGDFGCFSFHETKNFSMGEGGAIVLPNLDNRDRCEIYREKDRSTNTRGRITVPRIFRATSMPLISGHSSRSIRRFTTTACRPGTLTTKPSVRSRTAASSSSPSFRRSADTTPTCTT